MVACQYKWHYVKSLLIQHPSLPGKRDDWERQADSSDVRIDACVVHLNDWISDDVSDSLRL